MEIHPLPPIVNADCTRLVLGSFPSVASREAGFYYGHPRNRFWPMLAALWHAPLPQTDAQKTALLLSHGVALWDVVASCEIRGSADSSITAVTVNDLSRLFAAAPIRQVFFNGRTAQTLWRRWGTALPVPAVCLPSTSPANAACSWERLCEAWECLNGD